MFGFDRLRHLFQRRSRHSYYKWVAPIEIDGYKDEYVLVSDYGENSCTNAFVYDDSNVIIERPQRYTYANFNATTQGFQEVAIHVGIIRRSATASLATIDAGNGLSYDTLVTFPAPVWGHMLAYLVKEVYNYKYRCDLEGVPMYWDAFLKGFHDRFSAEPKEEPEPEQLTNLGETAVGYFEAHQQYLEEPSEGHLESLKRVAAALVEGLHREITSVSGD